MIPAIYNLLAVVTGHHWTTHGILVIILFLLLGFVFSNIELSFIKDHDNVSWIYIIGATIIGFLMIFVFFVIHYIGIIQF